MTEKKIYAKICLNCFHYRYDVSKHDVLNAKCSHSSNMTKKEYSNPPYSIKINYNDIACSMFHLDYNASIRSKTVSLQRKGIDFK